MQKILIVEDEPSMRLGLKDNLDFEGYEVDLAEDGEVGLKKILSNQYDLILLDVMLPKISGFDLCKKIRAQGVMTPLIMLTAKGEEIDKVLGLELGADDYVTKPFSVRELGARIKSLLRRSINTGDESFASSIQLGQLEFDFNHYTAKKDGLEIKMSHKEFEILRYLYVHKNTPVDRYELLEKIWGYDEQPKTRTVDNFIVRLRQKIEVNPGNPRIILTVHGAGYKLID